MKYALFILGFLYLSSASAANQWVYGKVDVLEDYGSYSSGSFQVLITLVEKQWGSGSPQDGEANCTQRFRVMAGEEGVDENIKNRIFSMMLSAHMGDKNVGLYVNTSTGPRCKVQIGRISN